MQLIIAHSQLNSFGGGERATLELLQRLSGRHEVCLWASHYQPEQTYPELAAFPRRILRDVEWLTARPVVPVVIAQTFGANLLALRHARTLCYVHTLRSRYFGSSRRPELLARRLLDRTAVNRAAHLFTNSAYSAGRIKELYGRNATILSPGVEDDFFTSPVGVVGSYGLYVGRLAPEKGIERLLRWSRSIPLELVVTGSGDPGYVAHLKRSAGPATRFTGPLTGTALRELYRGCRFLAVLPYAEEFGLVALEAMAAAKPVLAAREGGLPELISDGKTGFLVENEQEFSDAALRLASDDDLCLQLGRQGREVAEAFSWQRFAAGLEQACQELFDTV